MNGWIGVDLDGTLAEYHGWVNTFHIGPPVPAMLERVKKWLAEGQEVRIFTARIDGGGAASKMGSDPEVVKRYEDVAAITDMIQKWCIEHVGQALPVTCKKDYGMVCLYDDRCVQVESNTGRLIGGGNFMNALATADGVFEQYKQDQFRWWKRIDGTPILHDIAARMAKAFTIDGEA